jgi:hypothetical protein
MARFFSLAIGPANIIALSDPKAMNNLLDKKGVFTLIDP